MPLFLTIFLSLAICKISIYSQYALQILASQIIINQYSFI